MTRKNLLFVAGCSLFFLAACQSSKDQIVRKWQVESVDNPAEDSSILAQQKSIDTITTLDSSMITYFGSTNVDSIKSEIKKEFLKNVEQGKKQRSEYLKQITMDFRSDSIMIQTAMGNSDTAKWYLAGDKDIVLVPLRPIAGAPDRKDTFHIEKIGSSNLRLKITQSGMSSYINLIAATEKKAEKKEDDKDNAKK